MAAAGPAFKSGFVDRAPASNADVARTTAGILGLEFEDKGKLAGRVLTEALVGGAMPEVKSTSVLAARRSRKLPRDNQTAIATCATLPAAEGSGPSSPPQSRSKNWAMPRPKSRRSLTWREVLAGIRTRWRLRTGRVVTADVMQSTCCAARQGNLIRSR
jgi:hypothetical protein